MTYSTFSPAGAGGETARAPSGLQTLASDLVFRAHCLNRHATNLSIMKYYDFQGFLVTGQHSGTHWIKWMLSHAVAHRFGVEPPRYFNNASSNELIGHPKHPRIHPDLPRIASTHTIPPYALDWAWLRAIRRPPPYAVVVRDLRDAMVSNYEKWRTDYAVPFSTYVAGDPKGDAYVCDAWWYVRFLNRWGEVGRRPARRHRRGLQGHHDGRPGPQGQRKAGAARRGQGRQLLGGRPGRAPAHPGQAPEPRLRLRLFRPAEGVPDPRRAAPQGQARGGAEEGGGLGRGG
jgi:hypothetical protein